jgi:hypothetical protein
MHSMDYFFKLRRSQENDTSDNEFLRKKVEDSEAALALAQAQKEQELSHLRTHIVALEIRLSEDALVAQAKINDLEATLTANNMAIQNVQKELSSVKIQVELDSKALEVRISHSLKEAATQRSRAEGIKAHLHRAMEQLHKYKEKARSFYRQFTFISWARDTGFHMGYMEGIETLRAWVQKPDNFSRVDKVVVEEFLPPKRIVENMLFSRQEMLDCRGIRRMRFDPYLIYNHEARAAAKLSPRIELRVDSDIDSTGSVNSSAESWDDLLDKDPIS